MDGETEIIPIKYETESPNPSTTPTIGVKVPVTANNAEAARVAAHNIQNIFVYYY